MRIALVLLFLLSIGITGAIEPLEDKIPPNVPAENVTIGENIEVGSPVVKETKISIARLHEAEVNAAALIEVKLLIENGENAEMRLFVTEFHIQGVEYVDPIEVKYVSYQSFRLPYYGWSLIVPAKSSKELVYHIRATNAGVLSFSPATVADEYGNVFESAPTVIKVRCNANGVCENGENFANCPEDCSTGIADDNCDGAAMEK